VVLDEEESARIEKRQAYVSEDDAPLFGDFWLVIVVDAEFGPENLILVLGEGTL
jgi:hypothetical protein